MWYHASLPQLDGNTFAYQRPGNPIESVKHSFMVDEIMATVSWQQGGLSKILLVRCVPLGSFDCTHLSRSLFVIRQGTHHILHSVLSATLGMQSKICISNVGN